MKWSQATPPSNIWTAKELAYHLRLDEDIIAPVEERCYLESLQAAAVEFAETAMGCSLLTRTVTAIYTIDYVTPATVNYRGMEVPYLPRGPIASITSVTDARGAITGYSLSGSGASDILYLPNGWLSPLTVVYQAGYGSTPASVPADIKHAIRTHVATLYDQRNSALDRTITEVPHGLEAFYRRKSRICFVG